MSQGLHLSLRNVTKTFQGDAGEPFTALSGLDLDVRGGELLTLVGPSGCGKSTVFALIAGLTRPTAGQVLIDGAPVTGPALDRGVVVQQHALFPWRTAQANVEFGLEARAVPIRERARRARELLGVVGLSGVEERYPYELSGGERQLVAIARSLAFDPGVLLMDEPFAGLDARTREWLQERFVRVWRHTGKTVVFVTHDVGEAVCLGRRVAVMTAGPGRVKEVVKVGIDPMEGGSRAHPAFAEHRRHVGSLLRDELAAARARERKVTASHG
ncbi:ABC transporter ATP-binding protein [Nonomuraea sp. NPDC049709]|uniref:ABC transporter ATP-binding protein n=1 Tax=Nonomuraea sp. NPDC049709 TaxID=3154736 RepID=UPI0034425079